MANAPHTVLQHRIAAIKAEIATLGPLRPGTLSRQYNVCGTAGCWCKDDPDQRHGPYTRLRELVDQWVEAAIELARLERHQLRSN